MGCCCGTGDQFSIADLHLGVWLARIARLAGATAEDDGKTMVKRLGEKIGETTVEDKRTKAGTFWDGMRDRGSWKKVYGRGLF